MGLGAGPGARRARRRLRRRLRHRAARRRGRRRGGRHRRLARVRRGGAGRRARQRLLRGRRRPRTALRRRAASVSSCASRSSSTSRTAMRCWASSRGCWLPTVSWPCPRRTVASTRRATPIIGTSTSPRSCARRSRSGSPTSSCAASIRGWPRPCSTTSRSPTARYAARDDVLVSRSAPVAPGSEPYTIALASRQPLPSPLGRVVLAGAADLSLRSELERASAINAALTQERDSARADLAALQGVERDLRADNETLLAWLDDAPRLLETRSSNSTLGAPRCTGSTRPLLGGRPNR